MRSSWTKGPNGQERAEFSELWRVAIADKREQAVTHDDALLIESFRVSPDGKKIAMIFRRENTRNGQNRAEIAVVDMATGALRPVTHNNAPEQNVQWSPEGKVLVLPRAEQHVVGSRRRQAMGGARRRRRRAAQAQRLVQRRDRAVPRGPPTASRSCSARTRARAAASFRMSVANGAVDAKLRAATGRDGWSRSPPTASAASPSSARPTRPARCT